ncbi:MAG: VPS10 domain-containing protein [Chitinophagia bacterium]
MIKKIIALLSLIVCTEMGIAQDLNKELAPLKWRSIGPFRGGRSNMAAGVLNNRDVYYMGTTGGGLWKTENSGISWNNVSDGFFKTGSVGAVAVAESDANIVYVGMGEHAVRGVMTHHGDGVYKSTDAGKTWKKMGLDATQHISRIAIDPKNPNIVFIAAQGALYSKSSERGIYKSIDGGVTWKKVLYVDEKTGCAELSMDMHNPSILYAAMWEHGRLPWQVISGGPGSGLYKSTDGGNNWVKMENGLPKEMGKMSIAVSRANPEKVFALIESDFSKDAGGLYVSNDAGANWSQINKSHRLIQRAWYYIELFPDPTNENNVYVMSAPSLKSIDGGKTFVDFARTHGDYHDLWIHPNNGKNMVIADDGGAAVTHDGGKSWSSQNNMPTAQFYRINVDNEVPYNIYAGQQDNSSVKIASRAIGAGGIDERYWSASAGGESAFLAFDPNNPRYVLGGSYQGTIEVLDTKTKASTNIMAAPIQYLGRDAKDIKYRYNWNAPIIWSKHEPNTYYHGAQYLLKTSDMGKTWKEISPDLTRNEKSKQGRPGIPFTNEAVGAENYGTLAYVMESVHEKGVIYTGSDDGFVYLTKDGGATWKNITPAGLAECLINAIEVSPHDKATVYIATTRYKFNDHTPGLYKSTDYGTTWTKINTGIANNAFTRVVREDNGVKDLLYAGTELGVYISNNGGKSWSPFQLNLPITPITDLRVHQNNLIAATSGRSFWILDDLNLIRAYKADTSNVKMYKPDAVLLVMGSSEMDDNDADFTGAKSKAGVNPATGMVLYYQLPKMDDGVELIMEISDASGKLVRRFSSKADENYKRYDGAPRREPTLSKEKGLNRFVWNLRHATITAIPNVYIESSFSGHKAIPGNYTIRLMAGGKIIGSTTGVIEANPNFATTASEYQQYDDLMRLMESTVTEMHQMVNQLKDDATHIEALVKKLKTDATYSGEQYASLKQNAASLITDLKAWDEDMIQRRSTSYDDVENFPNKFTANYMFMMNQTESDIPQVNQQNLDLLKEYTAEWEKLKARGLNLKNVAIPALNKQLWELGMGAIW